VHVFVALVLHAGGNAGIDFLQQSEIVIRLDARVVVGVVEPCFHEAHDLFIMLL